MACGLFGKLPARRDFVSTAVPRRFLDPFERWLQGSVAGSRQMMGEDWQPAYLRMPIWRFFLGAAHTGTTATGAFMPSVDGAGRYFPLAIFAVAEEGEAFAPPDVDEHADWHSTVEALLLSGLDGNASFEALRHAIEIMPAPPAYPLARPDDPSRLAGGGLWVSGDAASPRAAVTAARSADHPRHAAALCCFWTVGGEDFPPSALVDVRLPDAAAFPALMTGDRTAARARAPVGGWE